MVEYYVKDEWVIIPAAGFEPSLTFDCGQSFRFDAVGDGVFRGVAKGRLLTLNRCGDEVLLNCSEGDYVNLWHHYLDMGYDYAAARKRVSIDLFTSVAARYGSGIHILNQEFWETLCSFIISACNNISRIKSIISRLCASFGEPIEGDAFTFPTAERLAALEPDDLAPLRTGYRAAYIVSAARMVANGDVDIDAIKLMSTDVAIKELCKIPGVGPKVASCVLLFGVGKRDAFPVDTWMRKAIARHYPPDFDPTVFGADAGLAQQYIFHYERTKCDK